MVASPVARKPTEMLGRRSRREGKDGAAVGQEPRGRMTGRRRWIALLGLLEQALSGGVLPPREVADEAAMIERVGKRRGAIGYVSWEALRAASSDRVRVISPEADGQPTRPGDPGYPLRPEAR
jgi:hypothetical protein